MKSSRSSLQLEVNHFLYYVQDKFSEVLLPVDTITKQGLLGKGYKKYLQWIAFSFYTSSRSIRCGSQRGTESVRWKYQACGY